MFFYKSLILFQNVSKFKITVFLGKFDIQVQHTFIARDIYYKQMNKCIKKKLKAKTIRNGILQNL